MSQNYYIIGNQKPPKIQHFKQLPSLLSELESALRYLDKNKYNYDPADYKNKRNDILNRALTYYIGIMSQRDLEFYTAGKFSS